MGQKVHPYGFRLGVNKPWKSRWFVERGYDKLLIEDVKLKAELREKLKAAGVSSVEVERPGNKLRFLIRTARPGIVIGRKGALDHWVAVVRPGKILFEMEGVAPEIAQEAMRLASNKLPLKTKFVMRPGAEKVVAAAK